MLQHRNNNVNKIFGTLVLYSCTFNVTIPCVCTIYFTIKGVISIRLAEVRKAHGLSQDQLAQLSGVGRVTIARIETGRISPNLQTLEKLAAALGVCVCELISEKAG